MAVSKAGFYQSDLSAVDITVAVGDLVVLDSTNNSGTIVPTGVSGGGVTTWNADGAAWNSTTNLVASGRRFWGVATSAGTFPATVAFSSSPSQTKTEATVFRDTALAPSTVWSVDATSQGVVTTNATTMTGLAVTSTTTNGVAYTFWCPQNVGSAGSTSGWTYVVDGTWTNVLAHRFVTATGSVAAPTSTQSPTGRYFRHATIFKAVAGGSNFAAAASGAGAGALSATASQSRAAASSLPGAGALTASASQGVRAVAGLAAAGALQASMVHPPEHILNIGPGGTENYFNLQYARPGDADISIASLSDIAAGFQDTPYFYTTPDDQRVHFEARLDAPLTSGSSFSRSELRQVDALGNNFNFDAMSGSYSLSGTTTITHLPPVKPEVVIAQLHNGSSDRVAIRTQLVSGTIRLRVRINGTSVTPELANPYVVGTEFSWKIEVIDGTVNVYYGTGTTLPGTPTVTGSLVSTGSPSWYFKSGLYNQSNTAAGDIATEYGAAELRNLVYSQSSPTIPADAALTGAAGSLSATAGLSSPLSVPFTAAGLLGATPSKGFASVAQPFAGAGTFSATARTISAAAADFAGTGALGASATLGQGASAQGLSAAGAFTATAFRVHFAQVAMVASGKLQISVTPAANAALTGEGLLGAAASQRFAVTGTPSAAGALTADANQDQRVTAAHAAVGSFIADGRRVHPAAATLGAVGAVSFDGRRVHPLTRSFAGAGALSAAGTRVHAAQVSMGAFGTFQARPATAVGGSLNVSVYAIDPSTSALIPLPDFESVTLSPILNENGAVELSYPSWGKNFNRLRSNITSDRDIEIEVWISGRRSSAIRGIIMESSGDDVEDGAVWTFTGPLLNFLMSEIVVFPQAGAEKLELIISAATAGKVIRTIVQQAQARGALAGLTLGFSDSVDSNGLPWVSNVTTKFSPGITGKSVLDTLVSLGLCEWEITTDRVLKAYAPGTFGIDRTVGSDPVVLRRGRQVPEAPRKHTVRNSPTSILAAGAEGIYQSANDPAALSRRGRRVEGFASANNIEDSSAVYGFAQTALNASSSGVMELTQGVEFTPGDPRPGASYNVGDWVFADTQNTLERLRIKQWTITFDRDGASGTVSLGDLISERAATLAKRIEALSNGSATVGTSTSTEDTGVPQAPAGLTIGSVGYTGPTGDALSTVTVGWSAVTTNTNGTPATDISGYNVEFRYNSGTLQSPWTTAGTTQSTQYSFGDVTSGQNIEARVQAVDRSNNVSAWTVTGSHTTATTSDPPAIPSNPVVDNFLGVIRITWDGLTSTGTDFARNFDYVEVHVSTSAAFVPDGTTLVGTLNAKGSHVYTSDNYGVTYYARLVAVNTANLKSTPSGTGSAAPERVVGLDIFDGAIGTAKLADAAITTAKINDLAVNNAKIGDVSVGKITAGTLTAAVILSGSIATATTGNRMLIDNSGWTAYNSSGTVFARLNVLTSTFLMTGQYQTALTGQRIVMNPGSSLPDTIYVYPSGGGDFGRIMARTAPSDGSAAILIDGGAATGVGRGRLGAYKGEAFVSFVTNDAGGDSTAGYSRTAVSCNNTGINTWVQSKFYFSKYSGTSFVPNSQLWVMWADGTLSDSPVIGATAQDAGLKFDQGAMLATNAIGTLFGPFKASAVTQTSTAAEKTDITPTSSKLTPLDVITNAPSKAWKYTHEVEEKGADAPQRFGPLAEQLPADLVWMTPRADGAGLEPSIELGSQIGVLWAAVNQLLARRITSTTATCVVPAGVTMQPGKTQEVPCTWESSPLAVPTDALVFLNAGLLGAGKVTAWIKPGSVNATGCTVIFKNTSTTPVMAVTAAVSGLTSITATVVGQALYTPPDASY